MKLVYKCDFCLHLEDEDEKEKIEKHEKECGYNPINLHCNSCEMQLRRTNTSCKIKKKEDYEDVYWGFVKCDNWKERKCQKNF